MAQLRVKTVLQNDYDVDIPNQLPPATTTLPSPIKGPNNIRYPTVIAQPDSNGMPNIVYDSSFYDGTSYDMFNVYWDPDLKCWTKENMQVPDHTVVSSTGSHNSLIMMAMNPVTGKHSYAHAYTDHTGNINLWYLSGSDKYPHWITHSFSWGSNMFNMSVVADLAFDADGTASLYSDYIRGGGGAGLQWYPDQPIGSTGTNPYTIQEFNQGLYAVQAFKFGTYQNPSTKPDLSPTTGYYATAALTQPMDQYFSPYRFDKGTSKAVLVTNDYHGLYQNVDPFFLASPSAAPLLFGSINPDAAGTRPRAVFICNTSYTSTPQSGNARSIFKDVPADRKPVWVSGLATQNEDAEDDDFQIHAFGAFQRADSGIEIWHTESMTVSQVANEIYDVPEDQWYPSSVVTSDVLSRKNKPFWTLDGTVLNAQPFTCMLCDGAPTLVFVNDQRMITIMTREAETGSWSTTVIDSPPSPSKAGALETKHVYHLELTAIREDGTPLGGLPGQIGCESRLDFQIDGRDVWVDNDHPTDFIFSASGRIGVTIPADGKLIPSSFWVKMEGMAPDTVIDVQPSAEGLHESFADLSKNGLATIHKNPLAGGGLLVSQDVINNHSADVTAASSAVSTIASLITDPADDTDIAERQHIYKSTPNHLARCRKLGDASSTRRLGRLKAKPGTAFCIDFQNGLKFQHLDEKQLQDFKNETASLDTTFFDSIGDLFSNALAGVYELGQCTVSAINDTLQGTFILFVDSVRKAWNFTLELASQAAELAVMVFDAIKVAFQDLFEWLAWFFDTGAIMRTQVGLKNSFNSRITGVENKIDTMLSVAESAAFQTAAKGIDSIFDAAKTAIGSSTTIDSLVPPPSPTVGGKASVGATDVSGQVDSLPSAATWLLQKLAPIFDFGGGSLPSAEGVEDFTNEIRSIVDGFISDETSDDAKAALDAFDKLFSGITSQGILNTMFLDNLLESMRAIAKLALDLMKEAVAAFHKLLMFAIRSAVGMFTRPITNGLIVGIYNLMTSQSLPSCTALDILSLILAIPYTLLYKAIAGIGPYDTQAIEDSHLSDEGHSHMDLGIFSIIETIFSTIQEVTEPVGYSKESRIEAETKGLISGMKLTEAAFPLLPAPPGRLMAHATFPPGRVSDPPTPTYSVDDVLSALDIATITASEIRLITAAFKVPGAEYIGKGIAAFQVICGGVGIGFAANELANGTNQTDADKLLLQGAIVGGVKDITNLESLFKRTPNPVRLGIAVAVVISRFGLGIAQAGMYIKAASQQTAPSLGSVHAAKEEAKEEVQQIEEVIAVANGIATGVVADKKSVVVVAPAATTINIA